MSVIFFFFLCLVTFYLAFPRVSNLRRVISVNIYIFSLTRYFVALRLLESNANVCFEKQISTFA